MYKTILEINTKVTFIFCERTYAEKYVMVSYLCSN